MSGAPSSRSSCLTWALTPDWLMWTRSAARVKLASSATATKSTARRPRRGVSGNRRPEPRSGGRQEALDPGRRQSAEDRMDLPGRERDLLVVEPPDEETHAGADHELHGGFELGRVGRRLGEPRPEMLSHEVVDALPEHAADDVGASLAGHRFPEAPVRLDVREDDDQRLEQRARASRVALARMPLGGEGCTYVLEPGVEQVLLVAVVRVEGRSPDVGLVEDVLHGDAVVALLEDEREEGAA